MSDLGTGVAWWRDRDWVLHLIKRLEALVASIINGTGLGYTFANVVGGQTYAVKTTDRYVRISSDGGHAAPVLNLPAPTYIGEQHTFFWEFWDISEVPPVVNATAGKTLVPFSGLASSGGTLTTSAITTPGASYTLEWDGAEWVST